MTLIIVTAVFFMQYKYMLDYDLGYNTKNLLAFECRELAPHNETLTERLKQHPDVVAVTASHTGVIFSVHNVWGREIDGRQIQLYAFAVRWDFPEVMGIPVIEGEGFSGEGAAGQQIMFTRSTRPYVESLYEDGFFEEFEIKGTTDDLRLKSVGQADAMTCLYTHPRYQLSTFYVRILPGADLRSLEKYIKEVVQEIEPRADEPEIEFIEESLKAYYYNTRRETLIMGLFALIAVLLSLMGVFSIVMFETRHKETEISIRKVYGATVEDVVRMFNRRYIIIVALCFCIATPLAWLLTGRWLQQFAHRIPVPFWIFPAVLALILAITVSIVFMRSLRAARTNPAEALKKE
jgi:putative ABC transport system permease protein